MADNALSLLGLALRGNNLAVGEDPVEAACKAGRAKLVLTAADASLNSVDRARRWAENGGTHRPGPGGSPVSEAGGDRPGTPAGGRRSGRGGPPPPADEEKEAAGPEKARCP